MMIKKLIITLLLFLFCCSIDATTKTFLDSVQAALKTTTNKIEKLNCLYTLSFEYGFIDPKKGIEFGRECLKLANKENNLLYQLNAYNGIANAYETLANFDSAKYFHTRSYEVAIKMGKPEKMALTLFNVAICYKQQGEYETALKHYLSAYQLLETQPSYNPRVHGYISEMYMRLGNYIDAEYHARLGIKRCVEFKQDYIIYNMYVNLAKCYVHNGKSDSAIYILNNTIQGLKKNIDKTSIAFGINALAETYAVMGNYKQATRYFNEELSIHKEINNENGIYLSNLNIANSEAHLTPNNAAIVLKHLLEADNKFPFIKKNADLLIESYKKIAETYALVNKYEKALEYYKLYYDLNDSLLNKEKYGQLVELQTKYETEKKEQLILSLKQNDQIKTLEIASQEDSLRKRNLLVLVCLLAIVLISLLTYFYLQKQKLKTLLEKEMAIKLTEEKERIRMAKDIHDDLGSGLSKINFLSELIMHKKDLSAEITENAGSIAETSKQLVVNMRDLIWALNPENTTLAGLLARIREYSSDYLDDFSAELKLKFPDDSADSQISNESHREILMTAKECLNNIVKHSKATIVEIEASLLNNLLSITVKDNGIGINTDYKKGNGLRNMQTRIEAIGGTFNLESNSKSGTVVLFYIPLEKIIKP